MGISEEDKKKFVERFIDLIKSTDMVTGEAASTFNKTDIVTRLVIVDDRGKAYDRTNTNGMVFSIQDDGKTLKIFME